MRIYLVHQGFLMDAQLKTPRPAGPITYRLKREDAERIAEYLAEKLHETRYHEYLASRSNVLLQGTLEQLKASDTAEVRAEFDALRNKLSEKEREHSRGYLVSEINVVGDDEEKLKKELEADAAAKI